MSYDTMPQYIDLGVLGEVEVMIRYWSTDAELEVVEVFCPLLTKGAQKLLLERLRNDQTVREDLASYDKEK